MIRCCSYIIKDYTLSRKVKVIACSVVAPVVVKTTHQLSGGVVGIISIQCYTAHIDIQTEYRSV
jgi:hypothetical protein